MKQSTRPMPLVEALMRERVGLTAEHLEERERRLRARAAMERAGFHDERAYASYLSESPHGLLDLASAMSVGETYFFRDPDQLKLLTDTVLPRLLLSRPREHILKIWSAGCASGEEAYTVAMLLDERGLLARAQIVATDISEHSLARARAGEYSAWSLRATPALAAQRYFTRVGATFQLSSALKAHVQFMRQSLTDMHVPSPFGLDACFDLILCKNVLIYLTEHACRRVCERLARALAPGGTLLTGASDPFVDLPLLWQRTTCPAGVIFTRLSKVRPSVAVEAEPSSLAAPARKLRARARVRGVASTKAAPREAPPAPCAHPKEPSAQGVESLRRELHKTPLSEELHVRLAAMLIELGLDSEAYAALRTLLYLNRELPVGHFLAGIVLFRLGEVARARRAYLRVVALCEQGDDDALVPYGDGATHRALREAALEQARLLTGGEA